MKKVLSETKIDYNKKLISITDIYDLEMPEVSDDIKEGMREIFDNKRRDNNENNNY